MVYLTCPVDDLDHDLSDLSTRWFRSLSIWSVRCLKQLTHRNRARPTENRNNETSKPTKTKQNKTKQNKTKQNKTKQNKTKQKQNKTKQNTINRVFAIYQLCWVENNTNTNITKPTNSPTQEKIRFKRHLGPLFFSHSNYFLVGWDWFYIGNRLQKT